MTLTAIHTEMFRRRKFGFISKCGRQEHRKQGEALRSLTDDGSREVFFGGAAGGAKSWTGASWLTFSALAYPQTRWFVGRSRLNDLREGTKVTFAKVFNTYGITSADVTYNGQDNFYKFANGSTITFLEMKRNPSDPLFERFGSKEYTGGWLEEAGEIAERAFEVIRTRVGRHYNDRYGLSPVLFITANPKKNWLYTRYYKAYASGSVPEDTAIIMSTVDDNPFIDTSYRGNLERLTDKVAKERLLYGVWDYEDNPNALIDRLALDNLCGNELADRGGHTYLTADIARLGSDRAVLMVWRGHSVIHLEYYDKSDTQQLSGRILALMEQYRIPRYRAVADEDGIGGGVVDMCRIEGFHNGGRVYNGENFANLKTQCIYKTAADVNDNLYSIDRPLTSEEWEMIRTELEQLQNAAPDTDGKMKAKSKEDIKRDIGRSPDFSDAFIMRKYFDLRRTQNDRVCAPKTDFPV